MIGLDEKNRIIVEEIKKWQQSRLLPNTYCEFLLSLYLEGDKEDTAQKKSFSLFGQWKNSRKSLLFALLFLMIVAVAAAAFLVVPAAGKLVITGIALLLSVLAAVKYKHSTAFHIFVILLAFLSFMFTLMIVDVVFNGVRVALGTGIGLLSFSWLILGWKTRIAYLLISGGAGILILGSLLILERI